MEKNNDFNILDYLDDIFYVILDDDGKIHSYSNKEALVIYQNLITNSISIKDHDSTNMEYYIKNSNKFYELISKKIDNGLNIKILKDITKHKIREKSLQIDKTTGLPNKNLTDNLLNNCILESKEKNEEFSILFCDIDFFKQINDVYGHDAGDIALGFVGELFRNSTRQINNPTYKIRPLDITGRHGGEEFLIVLRNINSENTVIKAEEIRKQISSNPISFGNNKINITISIGFYHVNFSELEKIDDIDEFRSQIMKKADIAMYESKKDGRNKVTEYTENVSRKRKWPRITNE